jgi:Bacterial Ig-like domain (group 2).
MDRYYSLGISCEGGNGFRYAYTNTGEDLPVESLLIEKDGFSSFTSPVGSYHQIYDGLYKGWAGEIKVTALPVNTTDTVTLLWSSSDESVLTVEDGVVTATGVGTATITAACASFSEKITIIVRGISIISADNGVNAENLAGNMDISNINSDELSIELKAEEVDVNNWGDSSNIKSKAEQLLNLGLDYYKTFDIRVLATGDNLSQQVQPEDGKTISITLPVSDDFDASKTYLIHINDDGTFSKLCFTIEQDADGTFIRFETEHFCKFALLQEDEDTVPTDTPSPTIPTNTAAPVDTPSPKNTLVPTDMPSPIMALVSGGVVNATESENNMGGADFNDTVDGLKAKVLTDTDKEAVKAGASVNISLVVEDISSTISAGTKSKIEAEAALDNAVIGAYLDISILKQIGTDTPEKITETNGKVVLSLTVPEELRNKNSAVVRSYVVLRLHDGAVTKLPAEYDSVTGKLTFETDRFTIYALAYIDAATSLTPSPMPSSSNVVNTGGGSNFGLWLALIGFSVACLLGALYRRRKNKK